MARQSIFRNSIFWGSTLIAIAAMLPRLGFSMETGSVADVVNQVFTLVGTNMTIYGTATRGQAEE